MRSKGCDGPHARPVGKFPPRSSSTFPAWRARIVARLIVLPRRWWAGFWPTIGPWGSACRQRSRRCCGRRACRHLTSRQPSRGCAPASALRKCWMIASSPPLRSLVRPRTALLRRAPTSKLEQPSSCSASQARSRSGICSIWEVLFLALQRRGNCTRPGRRGETPYLPLQGAGLSHLAPTTRCALWRNILARHSPRAGEGGNPVIKAVRAFTPAVDYWVPARASPVEPGSLGRDDNPYAIALPFQGEVLQRGAAPLGSTCDNPGRVVESMSLAGLREGLVECTREGFRRGF